MKKYIGFILLILFVSLNIVNAEETLFEGIGHYAFATAGTNFAYRGDSFETRETTKKFIFDSPSDNSEVKYDWDKVYSKIKADGYELTNLTGSYLGANGTLKQAIMINLEYSTSLNKVIVIKPTGEYFIYNGNKGEAIDITAYLDNNAEGWYYVSYLTTEVQPHDAWSITAIYENNNLANKYLKLINVSQRLKEGAQTTVNFNTALTNLDKFQVIGVIVWAGLGAFHVSEGRPESMVGDKAYAILDDGTEYQLYDRRDGHFTGRSNIDFACSVYSTKKSTYLKGGELDIFDETLSIDDYFGGKQLKSMKFVKTGANTYKISLLGLAQEVESPDLKIDSSVTVNSTTKTTNNVKLTNISKYSGTNTTLKIKYDESYTSVTDIILSNDKATYTISDGYINITIPNEFKSNEELTVTFIGNGSFFNNQEINLESEALSYPTILKSDSASYDIEKYKVSTSNKTNATYIETQETKIENPKTSKDKKILITISILSFIFITYVILLKKGFIRKKIV